MLKISICPAVVEDAPEIAKLNESCFGRPYAVTGVQAQLKKLILRTDEKVLVAVYRGHMIGYIHARDDICTYRAPRKTVVAVAVDKEYRRQGVASALFDAVTAWAKEDGCEAVSMMVGGSKAAQSFFVSRGCEERLNKKQYYKTVAEPRSAIIERLEKSYGKKD